MKVNLFRGKRISDDKWVEGYYVSVTDFESGEVCPMIISADNDVHPDDEIGKFDFVDPLTVGQYLGIVDKNGTKVFEGDILKPPIGLMGGNKLVDDIRDYIVCKGCVSGKWTVTGNVHDNPELLMRE